MVKPKKKLKTKLSIHFAFKILHCVNVLQDDKLKADSLSLASAVVSQAS